MRILSKIVTNLCKFFKVADLRIMLQHEGIIAQNRDSKLKEKYVIEIKHMTK